MIGEPTLHGLDKAFAAMAEQMEAHKSHHKRTQEEVRAMGATLSGQTTLLSAKIDLMAAGFVSREEHKDLKERIDTLHGRLWAAVVLIPTALTAAIIAAIKGGGLR